MSRSMFRFLSRPAEPATIRGRNVYLRRPEMADHEEWSRLRLNSRQFLEPWEPTWGPNDLSRTAFRLRVRRYEHDNARGLAVPLFIFLGQTDTLVGGITLGYIRRGAAQSCMIGYWMGEAYAGKGHMRDALDAVVHHTFNVLRLHRIEAACIPDNVRSTGLLEKAGFRREGYLRGYLKINGVWRDHVLYARLAERSKPAGFGNGKSRAMHTNDKTVA